MGNKIYECRFGDRELMLLQIAVAEYRAELIHTRNGYVGSKEPEDEVFSELLKNIAILRGLEEKLIIKL